MLTFAFRGSVSDIDTSAEDEPFHPSITLVIDADDALVRVIAPAQILQKVGVPIAVGQRVVVFGKVYDYPQRPTHVATDLKPDETLH